METPKEEEKKLIVTPEQVVKESFISLQEVQEEMTKIGKLFADNKLELKEVTLLALLAIGVRGLKIIGQNFKGIYAPIKVFYNLP